ncbi:uncharacterized protein LOC17876892 [Capsella rubella]|uniref:uncharacterized protein LOC17876892 n=1 Tax=Capsella rubella TaxID=81985 RepID=UPI000CD56DC2|nr:uncharacterized protein LOC17876892 [Capsella rubella]
MEEKLIKFSSRAKLVCCLWDQDQPKDQPVHFLSKIYGPMRQCSMCGIEKYRSEYHIRCDTCKVEFHKNCYFQPRCRRSDLTEPHTLEKKPGGYAFCSVCNNMSSGMSCYHCDTCGDDFHDGCHLYLSEIRHPFHPLHPLKFTFSSPDHSFSDLLPYRDLPSSWLQEPSDSESEPETSESDNDASISDLRCKCCQKQLQEIYYHCRICNYSLNLTCTRNPPHLTISNLKCHEHPLTIFPRRITSPCDACGSSLDNNHDLVYTCHLCNYMIHRTCIYLPRVIKITRHQHRLSLSSSLPSGLFLCGVCRHPINVTYGQFSCQKGCDYAVHSKCAVEGRVWDGKDLEGVAEDPDEDNDIESFVRIDDETIQHFSHDHYLKHHRNNDVCDGNRFCQACTLPTTISEDVYSCIQCDFFLHEACATRPRKIYHPLHRHPLILHLISPEQIEYVRQIWGMGPRTSYEAMFKCNGCDHTSCGYMYACSEKDCKFQLDIRCASLPDPVIHGSHPHALFFNLTQGECMGCKSEDCSTFFLECMECKWFLGLKCASLPSVMYYKHDRHLLTLCYGEDDTSNSQYWCEICETRLDAKKWFYKCDNYCSVTVHISCLLGEEIFMKPISIEINDNSVSVLRNSGNTREICFGCDRLCTQPLLKVYSRVVSV